jgi:hypothetical protein
MSDNNELQQLKASLQTVVEEIGVIKAAIAQAENHILNDEKVAFWNGKLQQLREDKRHLIKTEEQLREQILVHERYVLLQKSSLGSNNTLSASSTLPSNPSSDLPVPERRGRSDTWTNDNHRGGDSAAIDENKYASALKQLLSKDRILKSPEKKISRLEYCNATLRRIRSSPAILYHRSPTLLRSVTGQSSIFM